MNGEPRYPKALPHFADELVKQLVEVHQEPSRLDHNQMFDHAAVIANAKEWAVYEFIKELEQLRTHPRS